MAGISLGAAALGAGINAGASFINTGMQMYENQKNREFTAEENAKARAWQERMSNTAYQRTVQDLEQAGLNKMLAFGANPANMTASSATTANTASVQHNADYGISSALVENARLKARQAEINLDQQRLDVQVANNAYEQSRRNEQQITRQYNSQGRLIHTTVRGNR